MHYISSLKTPILHIFTKLIPRPVYDAHFRRHSSSNDLFAKNQLLSNSNHNARFHCYSNSIIIVNVFVRLSMKHDVQQCNDSREYSDVEARIHVFQIRISRTLLTNRSNGTETYNLMLRLLPDLASSLIPLSGNLPKRKLLTYNSTSLEIILLSDGLALHESHYIYSYWFTGFCV